MPTYEFRCTNGHTFDQFHKISDAPNTATCPVCGAAAERVISGGAGLVFKGSGFYLTDYGKNAHRTGGSTPPKGDGGDAGGKGEGASGSGNKDAGGGTAGASGGTGGGTSSGSSSSAGGSTSGGTSSGSSSGGSTSAGSTSAGGKTSGGTGSTGGAS